MKTDEPKRKLLLWGSLSLLVTVIALTVFLVKFKKTAPPSGEVVPNQPAPVTTTMVLADAVYADLAVRHQLDNVSVFYFDGNPQNNIAVNDTRHWIPASTIKVYVAMYAFDQAAKGKLNLVDTVTVGENNAVASEIDTPDAPAVSAGQVLSLNDLIYKMISQSDNTAYNILLDTLDRREVTKYAHDLGLVDTNIGAKLNLDDSQVQSEYQTPGYGENTTTAGDFATAFILIKGGRIAGAGDLFAILSQQKINNMIPLFLPKDVTVAHKTGDLDPLYHDGGIVVGNNLSYVLSVFTNLGNPNVVAHLSELIYKKDPNLVGANLNSKETGGISPEQEIIDPLVLNPPTQEAVLGESTPSAIAAPTITASDLGITPNDLSLEIEKSALPRLIFSVNSRLRGLVPAWLALVKATAIFPSAKVSADVLNLKYQLAEANQLTKTGNRNEANSILTNVDRQLAQVAQNKAVTGNSSLQNMVVSIDEARFSIMGDELQKLQGDEKIRQIKAIADQARNTVKNIQPNTPKAISASNVTQKPILGQVTGSSGGSLIVQTAGGQQILLPAGQSVKMKDQGGKDAKVGLLSSIPVGTTVAVIAEMTSRNVVMPSFVLKNLPRQWVAPQPVKVIKVNTLNKTMVVSENGVPIQVDITPQTVIKGADTTISLKDIKIGDTVVVRGTDITPGTKTATGSAAPSTPTPAAASPSGASPSSAPSVTSSPLATPLIGTSTPTPAGPLPAPGAAQPSLTKPKVIEGKIIQIVEKSSSGKAKSQPQKAPMVPPAVKPPEVKPKKP